jgi:hypothetical protein
MPGATGIPHTAAPFDAGLSVPVAQTSEATRVSCGRRSATSTSRRTKRELRVGCFFALFVCHVYGHSRANRATSHGPCNKTDQYGNDGPDIRVMEEEAGDKHRGDRRNNEAEFY